MQTMAKKKPSADEATGPRKTSGKNKQKAFQLRLNPVLREQAQKLADRNASDLSDEIRRALREYLERNQLWPPPSTSCGNASNP
jgi:hypothetical protein